MKATRRTSTAGRQRTNMWDDRFIDVCRRHRELVAVYESSHGKLALLLTHTLVPIAAEHFDWLNQTRVAARQVIGDLRAAGFTGGTVVLQWLPLPDVARIVTRWVRQYDGDRVRRAGLLAVLERRLADERFLASRVAGAPASAPRDTARVVAVKPDERTAASAAGLGAADLQLLGDWYRKMAVCWAGIEPPLRRRLVLQTHVWIAECVLADGAGGAGDPTRDVEHGGRLVRALERLVSLREAATWRPWIELVRLDLQRALARPPQERTQAWARWLFLIPYGAPTPRRARWRTVHTASRGDQLA